ncbi:hypothetical protein PIB30_010283 [Stylosanthes scabra]|uniref:Uncharacterized protein n=1 Tax=Stylosanthes scabra TaxID=79078 RepID=A0ABU6T5E3_9FABA|nr:hypothetical protein [Stylosanthes scabra]
MDHQPSAPVPPTTACHVLAIPYPGRGHVNPMMNLTKLLLSKNPNINVTFLLTEEWLGLIGSDPNLPGKNFRFATIPNVIPSEEGRANDFVGFLESVMTKMEEPFENFLNRLQPPPNLIVCDSYLFWVVRIANKRSLPVASFWPMSASFLAVLKHYPLLEQHGDYPVNVSENGDKRVDYIPGNTSIRLADFPLHDSSWRSRKLLQLALNSVSWVQKSQYLLFPSIYELEPLAIDALRKEYTIPIYTIGPALPNFLDHGSNINSIGTNNHNGCDLGYINWLDNQPSNSVLYVSQGSFLSTSRDQIDEIAFGLKESGVSFLWVQRDEGSKLKEICGDRGLVLPWCDQLRVLSHHAIGGFWSHCGWNSTREGVFCGVPFLSYPLFMDQPLNCKYIVEDWKVGWRVKKDPKSESLITRDEIAGLIRKFMDLDSDEGREMRKRARELQQACRKAIVDGGSSENNINAFLRHVL